MKRFKRRKSIIGLYMIILSVADIFAIVLSGNMGGKYMSVSIILLAIGFYAHNAGKMEMLAIEKDDREKDNLNSTEEKASSLTLFIIQSACFVGTGVFGVLMATVSRYTSVFTSITMVFASILGGSFIIEQSLQNLLLKVDKVKK